MTGVVFGLKKLTHQLRPVNSAYTSFPSVQTAQIFAAATFLSKRYKSKFNWIQILRNSSLLNKHSPSEVIQVSLNYSQFKKLFVFLICSI